jgi:hypothetical protein
VREHPPECDGHDCRDHESQVQPGSGKLREPRRFRDRIALWIHAGLFLEGAGHGVAHRRFSHEVEQQRRNYFEDSEPDLEEHRQSDPEHPGRRGCDQERRGRDGDRPPCHQRSDPGRGNGSRVELPLSPDIQRAGPEGQGNA